MHIPSRILSVLWPDTCFACGRLGTQLCADCANHLTFWDNSISPATKSPPYPGLRTVFSALEYVDSARRLVKLVKFTGYWHYCHTMAELTVLQCGHQLRQQHIDVLMPVPLHPRRRGERGFNQSEKFAQQLAQRLHIPVDTTTLIRPIYRKKQSLQNRHARHSLEHDFALRTDQPSLRGKTVCLIDDVFTTGATLSACARAVEKGNPKRIIGYTFARTR